MKKWMVVIVLALAQFVMVLDSTVMNVSISTIVKDLNTTVSALQACITFYTLTMAALMLLGSKICSKLGLLKAFAIGSVIYGIGSLITGLSQSVGMLFLGWSVIEGLGAVLVIPAIAAIIATNYKGKDRITAFAVIGGVSGVAAALGPLIGGLFTTYLSWRYVFIAETVIMILVLLFSRRFKAAYAVSKDKIDFVSAALSSTGMVLVVFGMLQSKTWGWVRPLSKPEIAGHAIAPLGISIVSYLILFGLILLKLFIDRQHKMIADGRKPFINVDLFKTKALKAGMTVLASQYLITAAVFFIVPVYLQMLLGLDALKTGIKILPLSFGLIIFSVLGSKLATKKSPKYIVRLGQYLLIAGVGFLLFAINPTLTGYAFGVAMFAVGSGLGLLASQLGSVNMSSAPESESSEIGGLQGTYQNIGSSLGTALIGSVLILSLTSGFINETNSSNLPTNVKQYIKTNSQTGVQIVPVSSVESYALSKGLSQQEASEVTSNYETAQVTGLKESVFFLLALAILSVFLSKNLPSEVVGATPRKSD